MIWAGPRVLNDTSPAVDHVALNDLYFELSMLDKRQSRDNEISIWSFALFILFSSSKLVLNLLIFIF